MLIEYAQRHRTALQSYFANAALKDAFAYFIDGCMQGKSTAEITASIPPTTPYARAVLASDVDRCRALVQLALSSGAPLPPTEHLRSAVLEVYQNTKWAIDNTSAAAEQLLGPFAGKPKAAVAIPMEYMALCVVQAVRASRILACHDVIDSTDTVDAFRRSMSSRGGRTSSIVVRALLSMIRKGVILGGPTVRRANVSAPSSASSTTSTQSTDGFSTPVGAGVGQLRFHGLGDVVDAEAIIRNAQGLVLDDQRTAVLCGFPVVPALVRADSPGAVVLHRKYQRELEELASAFHAVPKLDANIDTKRVYFTQGIGSRIRKCGFLLHALVGRSLQCDSREAALTCVSCGVRGTRVVCAMCGVPLCAKGVCFGTFHSFADEELCAVWDIRHVSGQLEFPDSP